MFVKIIDNTTVKSAPNPIRIGKMMVSNPTEEQLKSEGYYQLWFTNEPSEDTETIIYTQAEDRVLATFM